MEPRVIKVDTSVQMASKLSRQFQLFQLLQLVFLGELSAKRLYSPLQELAERMRLGQPLV